MLTIAARELGHDPKTNSRLATAIEEARKENLPKENIDRAIKKASEKDGLNLKEVVYEAYGPGGSAIIITALTDNSNRTTNDIKHILSLHDGKLGVEGSAMWAFDRAGDEYKAKFPQSLSTEDQKKFENLLEALSEQDEIDNVFANIEQP